MGKPQKIESLGFALPTLFTIGTGETAELNQARFLFMELQPEGLQPSVELTIEGITIGFILKAKHTIVCIPDHIHLTHGPLLSPLFYP